MGFNTYSPSSPTPPCLPPSWPKPSAPVWGVGPQSRLERAAQAGLERVGVGDAAQAHLEQVGNGWLERAAQAGLERVGWVWVLVWFLVRDFPQIHAGRWYYRHYSNNYFVFKIQQKLFIFYNSYPTRFLHLHHQTHSKTAIRM